VFKTIQKFFDENLGHGEDSSLSRETLSLAAAAILFEVARADFDFSPVERKTLSELVAEQFNLNDEETEKLLLLAAKEADESPGLHEFTNLINQNWTIAERIGLIENMWAVVYADGRLDDNEQHLMRKAQSLLHVPHRDYIAAKLRHKTS